MGAKEVKKTIDFLSALPHFVLPLAVGWTIYTLTGSTTWCLMLVCGFLLGVVLYTVGFRKLHATTQNMEERQQLWTRLSICGAYIVLCIACQGVFTAITDGASFNSEARACGFAVVLGLQSGAMAMFHLADPLGSKREPTSQAGR